MRNRNSIVLILIILLALIALYIVLPGEHPTAVKNLLVWQQPEEYRSLEFKQGLDLRGGTQVLLQAKPTGRTESDAG